MQYSQSMHSLLFKENGHAWRFCYYLWLLQTGICLLEFESSQNWGLLLKERICSLKESIQGSWLFSLRVTPVRIEANMFFTSELLPLNMCPFFIKLQGLNIVWVHCSCSDSLPCAQTGLGICSTYIPKTDFVMAKLKQNNNTYHIYPKYSDTLTLE